MYLRYRASLIDYATPIVGSRSWAEDLVQEAYFRFMPQDGADRPVDQPVAYLYRIVRNLALDWRRRTIAEDQRDKAFRSVSDPHPMVPSPEDRALYSDELAEVDRALSELPDKMRLAFEMHRLGEAPLREIAERLDISVATAGRWTQQAHAHIARRLRDSES
nr:sigma-70 family RNA polymerase sigma factor [Marivibrio halodurans]